LSSPSADAVPVTVTPSLAGDILSHARAAWPEECCGLLLGDPTRILATWPARNRSDEPRRRYLVAPEDHFAAVRAGRARGLEVVGAYHSHPTGLAEPSETDLTEAPGVLWLHVIAVLATGSVRAWRLDGGNFREVPLVTCA
jgi:proteasome lid subunit RPN8/RPN11